MTQRLGKYLELTKPKVTLLNLLVGVTCFILAVFPNIDWVKLAVFSVAGYLAVGGCGALNSVYDRDIDKLMTRTSKRAIPAGHVSPISGLMFGSAIFALSVVLVVVFFNLLTVAMFILGAVFYLLVYTVWLKRSSPWNVVIGGFAGCFAALSGWAAAANTLSLMALLVAAVDFLWTPGHLWGLTIKKLKEYKKAGVPMLPVKVGLTRASQVVFWLNVLTVGSTLLFPLLHLSGTVFLAVALVGGTGFLFLNRGLLSGVSEAGGFKVFVASMPYLACLMAALIVDKIAYI